MKYEILASGSDSNCIVIEDTIALDMGISFKKLGNYSKDLKLVLLTHQHSDHFNKTTIKTLASKRPTLRWGCCEWLVDKLLECGVNKKNVDVYSIGKKYNYGFVKVVPILLYHDVPQCGYRIFYKNEKIFFATDTKHVDKIIAKDYDLYLIESNYGEDEIRERIRQKEEQGEFVYEYRTMETHLSEEQAIEFLLKNMGDNSEYVFIHQHKDKRKENKKDE